MQRVGHRPLSTLETWAWPGSGTHVTPHFSEPLWACLQAEVLAGPSGSRTLWPQEAVEPEALAGQGLLRTICKPQPRWHFPARGHPHGLEQGFSAGGDVTLGGCMAMSEARLIVTGAEMWPWHPGVEAGDAANILQCSGRPPTERSAQMSAQSSLG